MDICLCVAAAVSWIVLASFVYCYRFRRGRIEWGAGRSASHGQAISTSTSKTTGLEGECVDQMTSGLQDSLLNLSIGATASSTSSGNGSWLRSIENHQFIPHPSSPPPFDTTNKHADNMLLKPPRLTIQNSSPLSHTHLAGASLWNGGAICRNGFGLRDPELKWRGREGNQCVVPNGSSSPYASKPSTPNGISRSLKAGRNGLKAGRNGDSAYLPSALAPTSSSASICKAKGRIKPCYCVLSCLLIASLTFNAILVSLFYVQRTNQSN